MHAVFTIQGTHCTGCKALIEDVARDVPGVKAISVDPVTGKTELEYGDSLDWDLLKREIASAGHYTVTD